jgi:hypothetical protein
VRKEGKGSETGSPADEEEQDMTGGTEE